MANRNRFDYPALEDCARERLSDKRFQHSRNVAERAAELAGMTGADAEKARVAGILHDICKEMPKDDQLQYLRRHAILLDDDFLAHPAIWHGPVASCWVKEQLRVDDEEIFTAIWYHTIGRADMTPLEKAVFLADFTSADRDFFDAGCLRSIIKDSADRALVFCFRYNMNSVVASGKPIIRALWEAYNFYCKELTG